MIFSHITSNSDKDLTTTTPCESKISPDYLNMSIEQGKVQSEKHQNSNPAVDMKSTRGRLIVVLFSAKKCK